MLLRREFGLASAAAVTAGSLTASETQRPHNNGQRLRECREALQWSLEQAARELGVQPGEVAAWEAGQAEPPLSAGITLAQLCEVPVTWLCGQYSREDITGIRSPLANSFRRAREARGMSAEQVSLVLGLPASYWPDYESGHYDLSFDLGQRACLLFGVDPHSMIPKRAAYSPNPRAVA